jgi:hypothetical protein
MGCSICLSVAVWTKISAATIAYSLCGLRFTGLLTFGKINYKGNNVSLFLLSLLSDGHTVAAASLVAGLHGTNDKLVWKYRVAHEMSYHFIIPLKL